MLTKNKYDRMLFGVCGGLARNYDLDPTLVRLAFLLGVPLTGSVLFWAYLLLAVITPQENDPEKKI